MAARIDFNNEDVYVGIDVHKRNYSVVAWFKGSTIKKASMPAEPKKLESSLNHWFAGARIHSVYEAGFSGFGLHRVLTEGGINNIVINPASIEIAANDKKKTDRRDATKMAEQLSVGRLKGIHIPKVEEELRRQITRTREQVIKERSRVVHRIKSKLIYFGYISASDDRKMSHKYIEWIRSLGLPTDLEWSLNLLIEQWKLLCSQIKDIEIKLQEQAFEDSEVQEIYRSIPGVGLLSARILANELGDLSKRFKNQDGLYQFTGLTPSEHSSGESVRKGHIDRQGSSRIRYILVEIAWRAIRKDIALKQSFDQIALRRGKKIAIVAIARKLIGRMRACFVQRGLYQLGIAA
jgi:transposase